MSYMRASLRSSGPCFFFLFGTFMSGLQKVHGIASAHGPVAIVTAAAFGLAVMSVSLKF
jgi:hypothetical protein